MFRLSPFCFSCPMRLNISLSHFPDYESWKGTNTVLWLRDIFVSSLLSTLYFFSKNVLVSSNLLIIYFWRASRFFSETLSPSVGCSSNERTRWRNWGFAKWIASSSELMISSISFYMRYCFLALLQRLKYSWFTWSIMLIPVA